MNFEKLPEPSVPPRRPRARLLPVVLSLTLAVAAAVVVWRRNAVPESEAPRPRAGPSGPTDTELEERIVAAWQEGRRLRTAGQGEAAAGEFARALALQRQLNAKFPASPLVSLARLGEFEADRQTALAQGLLAQLRQREQQLDGHLRRRELHQARRILEAAAGRLGELREKFPQAHGAADGLGVKIAFLHSRADDLEGLQDRCYEALVPLPGLPQAMMREAVTQGDFRRITGLNPSAQPDAAGRVDSITQAEAEEFCRRLGWVLGHPVRLPEAAELRLALAAGRAAMAGGEEWLRAADGTVAPVFTSAGDVGAAAPRESRSPDRRFRVVVETDLAKPAG